MLALQKNTGLILAKCRCEDILIGKLLPCNTQ